MYILRNAAKNLLRNKGRNILIGIIMLAMLSATAISMIINTATAGIIADYKTRFGSEVVIGADIDKLIKQNGGQFGDMPEMTYEQKLAFADSDYLKETLFTGYYAGYNDKLLGVGAEDETEQDDKSQSGNANGYTQRASSDDDDLYHSPNLIVMGYSDYKQLTEFTKEARKITSGKLFQADNECNVSEDFAKLNKLKLGDEIEVKDCDKNLDILMMKLEIVGLYYDTTPATPSGVPAEFADASTNRRNEILVNVNTLASGREVLKKAGVNPEFIDVEPAYVLKSPDLLANFDAEVRQKGLSDAFKVSTDASGYNQIVKPVEGVANISVIFLILVLVIGAIILVLLSTLSIRERKYEIGVLRAMGMKKSAVARGLICETLITIAICLIIGLGVGSLCAQPVADGMLQNQIEASNAVDDTQNTVAVAINGNGGSNADNEDSLKEMKVSLTYDAVAQVAGIALLLGLLSGAAGLIYILRYEPMKILSERN
ncbi:ABC transporter permease [Bacteroidia bacterium]|nr:ABC transporter permease [Bacteroidia bacterium]